MGVLYKQNGITIRVNGNEHPPVHAHVLHADGKALVYLSGKTLNRGVPHAALKVAQAWITNIPLILKPNGNAGTKGDNTMTTPDRIQTVATTAPDILRIEFRSGKTYSVSLAAPMARIAGFAALQDIAEFNTATVADDGWTIEWACGLSMASERLYQMAKEQAGEALSQDEFKDWMRRNHLSLTTAADALSLSRRVVSQYSAGSRPIPKIVGLALKGFEAERRAA